MKRIRRIALRFVVLSALIAGCGCGKEETNVISVIGGEVAQGEEITVYVHATDEIPVSAYGINVYYNTDELAFKDCGLATEFEEAWQGLEVSNDTGLEEGKQRSVVFVGVNTTESQGRYQGDLFYITFTATGESGTKAELTLDVTNLGDLDGNEHLEEYTQKNGTITIK